MSGNGYLPGKNQVKLRNDDSILETRVDEVNMSCSSVDMHDASVSYSGSAPTVHAHIWPKSMTVLRPSKGLTTQRLLGMIDGGSRRVTGLDDAIEKFTRRGWYS